MRFENLCKYTLLILSLVVSSEASVQAHISNRAALQPTSERMDVEDLKFVTLINDFRKENGLSPLLVSKRLNAIARWMVDDMIEINYFDHTDSYGRDPFQRMEKLGYTGSRAMGENICAGTVTSTAEVAFQQWKNSPHHRDNMLDPHFTFMGIAHAFGETAEYGWYWANEFGSIE